MKKTTGYHHRFFLQVCTVIKMPSIILPILGYQQEKKKRAEQLGKGVFRIHDRILPSTQDIQHFYLTPERPIHR